LNQDSNENQAGTGAGGDNQNECDIERSHVPSSGKLILKDCAKNNSRGTDPKLARAARDNGARS
jgi:hypothetical protein